ncbi:hypothetical protein BT67DRAFT_444899 [Trichocladium antarcticum]|uniref:Uncharacterized protein n=1 Tax=Trichocladium antarcticum TaxID=1450529 RepID=A0AAN6UDQ0_9PEZI|nr:hypothetical protein BT67DRAFT_444899 [Trichocladium antarcticum]
MPRQSSIWPRVSLASASASRVNAGSASSTPAPSDVSDHQERQYPAGFLGAWVATVAPARVDTPLDAEIWDHSP